MNDDQCCHSSFDCHVTISNVVPDSDVKKWTWGRGCECSPGRWPSWLLPDIVVHHCHVSDSWEWWRGPCFSCEQRRGRWVMKITCRGWRHVPSSPPGRHGMSSSPLRWRWAMESGLSSSVTWQWGWGPGGRCLVAAVCRGRWCGGGQVAWRWAGIGNWPLVVVVAVAMATVSCLGVQRARGRGKWVGGLTWWSWVLVTAVVSLQHMPSQQRVLMSWWGGSAMLLLSSGGAPVVGGGRMMRGSSWWRWVKQVGGRSNGGGGWEWKGLFVDDADLIFTANTTYVAHDLLLM